jgi:hypothetical protein
MLLLAAVRCGCYVFFCSFGCVVEGMQFVAMRQMRLMRGSHNVLRLVKLGGFSVVPGCVFMMFSRKFVEFAQRHGGSFLRFSPPCLHGRGFRMASRCSAGHDLSLAISNGDNHSDPRTCVRQHEISHPTRHSAALRVVGVSRVSIGRRNDHSVQVCIAVLRICAGARGSKSVRAARIEQLLEAIGAVAVDRSAPHETYWATCLGVSVPRTVRSQNERLTNNRQIDGEEPICGQLSHPQPRSRCYRLPTGP